MNWSEFLEPEVMVFLVPIAAILVGGAIAITKLVIRHKERIAMIEHGIHPDHHPGGEDAPAGEDWTDENQ